MSARDVIADVMKPHPNIPRLPLFLKRADAILSALTAAGYVVAPVEPMPEFVAAWWRTKNGAEGDDTSDYAAYRALMKAVAMLAASQGDGK